MLECVFACLLARPLFLRVRLPAGRLDRRSFVCLIVVFASFFLFVFRLRVCVYVCMDERCAYVVVCWVVSWLLVCSCFMECLFVCLIVCLRVYCLLSVFGYCACFAF